MPDRLTILFLGGKKTLNYIATQTILKKNGGIFVLLANMVAVSQYILTVPCDTDNISRGRGVATLPNVRLVCHSKEKV